MKPQTVVPTAARLLNNASMLKMIMRQSPITASLAVYL